MRYTMELQENRQVITMFLICRNTRNPMLNHYSNPQQNSMCKGQSNQWLQTTLYQLRDNVTDNAIHLTFLFRNLGVVFDKLHHQADILKTTINICQMVQLGQLHETQNFRYIFCTLCGRRMKSHLQIKCNQVYCLAHSNGKEVIDGSKDSNCDSEMLYTLYP